MPFSLKDHIWLPAAVAGVIAGVGLTLVAVALGTLIFGTYGYGLFLLTPFVIGVTTGYIANYKGDVGGGRTALSVMTAIALGGIALVLVALEGIVCIAMAAPLGIGFAWVGGEAGRAMALRKSLSEADVPCLALLPLMFAVENVLPPATTFETDQTIEVHAPPEAVWRSILSTDPVEGPLALPFRLGVAYPLRGEVIGEGVGAVRRGEFSTGTAVERMTEWEPNRKLAFVVVDDIPAIRELSPYEHVHAPHVVGYFRTISTSFELVRRSDGHTDILERTSHELRLDPVPYWLPMARWIVRRTMPACWRISGSRRAQCPDRRLAAPAGLPARSTTTRTGSFRLISRTGKGNSMPSRLKASHSANITAPRTLASPRRVADPEAQREIERGVAEREVTDRRRLVSTRDTWRRGEAARTRCGSLA